MNSLDQNIPSFVNVAWYGAQTVDQRTLSVLSFLYPYFLMSYFRLFLFFSFFLFFFPFLFFLVLSFPLIYLSFSLSFFCWSSCSLCAWCPCFESYFFTLFLLFYPYVFVCYPYVARMYSFGTRMLPVCARMYSHVIGVYPYVLVRCFGHDQF